MRKEAVSLGDMVTVHELEWIHQPSCVFQFNLVPVPYVTDPLLLFLTTSNFSGLLRQGWDVDH